MSGCPCCGARRPDDCDCSREKLGAQLCVAHGCETCLAPRDYCDCWACEHDDTPHAAVEMCRVCDGVACPICKTRPLGWGEAPGCPAQLVRQVRVHPHGCWVFIGPVIAEQPRVCVHGEQLSARRVAWEAIRGPLNRATRLYPCTVNRRCVLPAHQHPKEMLTNDAA